MRKLLQDSNDYPSPDDCNLCELPLVSRPFDAYTVLAIAFALPQLITEWHLTPAYVGAIIAAGYVGQLVGAIFLVLLPKKLVV